MSSDVWSWSRTHRWGPGGRGTGGVQEGGRKGINEEGGRKDINEINEEHIEQEGGRAQREGAAGVRNCAQRRRWAGGVSTVFVCAGRNASSEGTPTRSQAVNTLSLSLSLSFLLSLAVVDL